MKKIKLIFFLTLTTISQLSAQTFAENLKFGIMGGYDFFAQDELKAVNTSVINSLPFESKVINDFKPSFYFGTYLQYELFNHFDIGPSYEYHYSGSRVGSRDYSGQFIFDQYIHTHQIALKIDYALVSSDRIEVCIQLNGGVNLSSWKMDTDFELGDNGQFENQQSTDELEGFSWHISPAIKCAYQLVPKISLTAAAAYAFDLDPKYHYKDNKDWKATQSPEWSGVNISLGLEFRLK